MSTFEESLERSFLEIKSAKNKYWHAPIPCETDEKIKELIKLYTQVSPAERLVFHEKAESIAGFLLGFAERLASLAVREHSREVVREGLMALIIEDCRSGDYRDTTCILALLYHAAGKVGADADTLFKEVASYKDNEAAQHMRRFPGRPAYSKELADFKYKEADTPDGFIYEQIPWY